MAKIVRTCGVLGLIGGGVLLAGCGALRPSVRAWPEGRVYLTDFEEFEEEWEKTEETQQPRRRGGARRRAASKRRGGVDSVGVRVGLVVPITDAGTAPDARTAIGGYLRMLSTGTAAVEAAIDVIPEEDDAAQNFLAVLRGGYLFSPLPAPVYGTVGAGLLYERFFGRSDATILIEAGVGLAGPISPSRMWDVRLSVQHLFRSDNVENLVTATAGLSF